ncbi:MAG: hypothetical protein CMM02_13330 [Rhodopirellula sp.]|jgi:hypothetical protein|nr:hypothetical protein [Rhodopirellula sp.]|tara:strand:- start:243 stop:1319 length:1077 start_codon:yes stop_codon:yes gene_type:complete
MPRANYAQLTVSPEHAHFRFKRLNKPTNDKVYAVAMDIIIGACPWLAIVALIATIFFLIHEFVEDAPEVFLKINAPIASGTISTFAAFLLVTKIQANLSCNTRIIAQFGNLTGSLINLALFVKSQILKGKSVEPLTLPDGNGSQYQTNRIALTLSSVPYIVKYVGRKRQVKPLLLPLGQDAVLVERYEALRSKGMSDFTTIVLIIGEQIDDLQEQEKNYSEYAVLFGQLNAVTAAEGTIGSIAAYNPPYILDALLYAVFGIFICLALIEMVPTNGAHAIWLSVLVTLCTAAFFQISDRYWNPFKLRSKHSGQDPIVSQACVATEKTITSVFERVSQSAKTPVSVSGLSWRGAPLQPPQ